MKRYVVRWQQYSPAWQACVPAEYQADTYEEALCFKDSLEADGMEEVTVEEVMTQ